METLSTQTLDDAATNGSLDDTPDLGNFQGSDKDGYLCISMGGATPNTAHIVDGIYDKSSFEGTEESEYAMIFQLPAGLGFQKVHVTKIDLLSLRQFRNAAISKKFTGHSTSVHRNPFPDLVKDHANLTKMMVVDNPKNAMRLTDEFRRLQYSAYIKEQGTAEDDDFEWPHPSVIKTQHTLIRERIAMAGGVNTMLAAKCPVGLGEDLKNCDRHLAKCFINSFFLVPRRERENGGLWLTKTSLLGILITVKADEFLDFIRQITNLTQVAELPDQVITTNGRCSQTYKSEDLPSNQEEVVRIYNSFNEVKQMMQQEAREVYKESADKDDELQVSGANEQVKQESAENMKCLQSRTAGDSLKGFLQSGASEEVDQAKQLKNIFSRKVDTMEDQLRLLQSAQHKLKKFDDEDLSLQDGFRRKFDDKLKELHTTLAKEIKSGKAGSAKTKAVNKNNEERRVLTETNLSQHFKRCADQLKLRRELEDEKERETNKSLKIMHGVTVSAVEAMLKATIEFRTKKQLMETTTHYAYTDHMKEQLTNQQSRGDQPKLMSVDEHEQSEEKNKATRAALKKLKGAVTKLQAKPCVSQQGLAEVIGEFNNTYLFIDGDHPLKKELRRLRELMKGKGTMPPVASLSQQEFRKIIFMLMDKERNKFNINETYPKFECVDIPQLLLAYQSENELFFDLFCKSFNMHNGVHQELLKKLIADMYGFEQNGSGATSKTKRSASKKGSGAGTPSKRVKREKSSPAPAPSPTSSKVEAENKRRFHQQANANYGYPRGKGKGKGRDGTAQHQYHGQSNPQHDAWTSSDLRHHNSSGYSERSNHSSMSGRSGRQHSSARSTGSSRGEGGSQARNKPEKRKKKTKMEKKVKSKSPSQSDEDCADESESASVASDDESEHESS